MSVIRLALLPLVLMAACSRPDFVTRTLPPVTLVIVNARVWTGEPDQPWAEAVAVAEDRIARVGTTDEIAALVEDGIRTIDAGGGLLLPGFIDTHVHFIDGGFRLASVELRDAGTRADFVDRIAAFAAGVPEGTWITGGDWDHERWGGELPARDWIDAVTPHHPVWVARLDGHMALANTAALDAAGVSRETPGVDGGEIVRDGQGEPTGILKDNAMALVAHAVPEPTPEQTDRALDAAMRYVAARGVTTVHHMGTWSHLDSFVRAWRAERLLTRIYAAVPLADWQRLRDLVFSRHHGRDGRGDAWLRIGGLKGFVDGSLGSRTAAFDAPYADEPENRGLFVTPADDLYEQIAGADASNLQVIVHAIGDRANRELLDIYARIARERGTRDRRPRIEHAQHLAPADIPRFAELGVIASMQPYHAIDDGRWAERAIGRGRAETTYAFRALLDAGATLAFGSDWFVAPPSPFEGIYAAVTRRTLDDAHPDGWIPAQRIAVEEAIRAYTRDAAYASFEEAIKGTVARGKLADLVLVDRDLFSATPDEIREARVIWTMVGGRLVYERVPASTEGSATAALYRAAEAASPPDAYRAARTQASPAALLAGDGTAWHPAMSVAWGPVQYRTTFRALWNEAGLFIRFDLVDERPWHTMTRRDDRLWHEEVVELFLDPTGTGRNYAELQINPANVVCDLRIERTQPFRNDIEWSFAGLESRVHPWADGGPEGWSAVAFLPFADLATLSAEAAAGVPPEPGARWRFNVFRIKRPGGPQAPRRDALYAAWSVPEGSSFHEPSAFRELVFDEAAPRGR